jgi:hypothetical protein
MHTDASTLLVHYMYATITKNLTWPEKFPTSMILFVPKMDQRKIKNKKNKQTLI